VRIHSSTRLTKRTGTKYQILLIPDYNVQATTLQLNLENPLFYVSRQSALCETHSPDLIAE